MTTWVRPSLRHLAVLTDDIGIVEHAELHRPRRHLGYCTDDAGRLLGLVARLPQEPEAHRLAVAATGFLERAWAGGGTFRLRLLPTCSWTDDPPSDDASARAVAGLAVASARAPWPDVRSRAAALFDAASAFRSPHPRAMACAALGAVELASVHDGAANLVDDAAAALPRRSSDEHWPWPEPRLSYANALLPDALIAAGVAAGDDRLVVEGLQLLAWLLAEETGRYGFSFTPVGGRGPGDPRPGFDQQPIEAWVLGDACARAHRVTGDPWWAGQAMRAARWFLGDNDGRTLMFDRRTGGGFDGLERRGVNRNQGAESSMAFVGTMAMARALETGQAAAAVRAVRR